MIITAPIIEEMSEYITLGARVIFKSVCRNIYIYMRKS